MYAFAIPKRTYYKSVTTSGLTFSYSKSTASTVTKDFGRKVKITTVNNTDSYAEDTYYDSSSEQDVTDYYTPTWTVQISQDGSNWETVGTVCESKLTVNRECWYFRMYNNSNYDYKQQSTTVTYQQTDDVVSNANDYTYYVDGCEAYVAKLGDEYYEVGVKE